MKDRFEISYRVPGTEDDWNTVIEEFESGDVEVTDGDGNYLRTTYISARDWAEDLAYSLADKGPYEIREIK